MSKLARVIGFGCFTVLAGLASADQADYSLADYTKIFVSPADFTAWTPLILLILAALSGWQTLNSLLHKPASETFIERKNEGLHNRIMEESELTREFIANKKTKSKRAVTYDQRQNSLKLAGAPIRFEKWRPTQRMPSPKMGETWSKIQAWTIPRKFEFGWAVSMGQQTYVAKNLIWARDSIYAIGRSQKYGHYTRLLHFNKNENEAVYLFAKKTKNTETTITKLSSIKPDNPDFVMSKLSGICVVKPVYDRESYLYSNYGYLIHLEPTLDSTNHTIKTYNEFPVPLSFHGNSKSAAIYGDRCNNIAVSSSSKIFHNAVSFNTLKGMKEADHVSLVWEPAGGHISHVRKGSVEGETYKAKVLKQVVQDEFFITAKWSPSENFILLQGMVLSILEDKLIKQTRDFPDTKDNFSRFIDHFSSDWHPSRDLLVLQGFNRVDDNTLEMRIEIWDAQSLELLRIKDLGHTSEYTSIKWGPDGTKIAFSNSDHSIAIWNLETDDIFEHYVDSSSAKSLHFSPDGQRLCFEYMQKRPYVGILDVSSAELLFSFKGEISEFTETPWHYLGRRIAYLENECLEVLELSF